MKVKAVFVVAGATLLLAGSADANCNSTCLGRKITSLQHTVKHLTGEVNALSGTLNRLSGTVSGQGTTLNSLSGTVSGQGTTLTSLSGKVNSLSGTVSTQGTKLACFTDTPVTQYGDPGGTFGYLFTNDGISADAVDATALDVTVPGDAVDAWAVMDSCNTTPTASAAVQSDFGSLAHIAPRAPSK
jgi:hypothetical protein